MNAKGHMATGALLCGIVGPVMPSPAEPFTAALLAASLGAPLALLMDLDTRGKAYYSLMPVSLLLKPLFVTISKVLFHLTRGPKDDKITNGHRMFTHQIEFAALLALSVPLWLPWPDWRWWVTVIVFVGVWSHRAGDACTKAGVPISLTRVIIRSCREQDRVWLTVGIPRRLRFVSGGKRGVKLFGAKATRVWDIVGEKVVTRVLTALTVVLFAVVAAGYWPLGWA